MAAVAKEKLDGGGMVADMGKPPLRECLEFVDALVGRASDFNDIA